MPSRYFTEDDNARSAALHDMLLRYAGHQRTNEPVHTWSAD